MKRLAILLSVACVFSAFMMLTACDKKADDAAPAAEAKADEAKADAKADEAKADAKADEAKADAKADEAKADVKADALAGKWKHEDGYVYDFKDDGTGSYTADGSDPMNFKYTAENGKLSLTYDGTTDPTVLDYEIKDNVLNVKDSLGKDTLYNRM